MVAQSLTLLYRGIAFCRLIAATTRWPSPSPTDYKSAIQQIENLRYPRERLARR